MEYFWLCASAMAAGVVNAVAGGGTLLTYPALECVLAAKLANATSTVALFPGTAASVWGYRRQLPACKKWVLWLSAPSLMGGAIGAYLVDDSFRYIIPYLILLAAILFTLQPTLAALFKRQASAIAEPGPALLAGIVIAQFAIGVEGGYVGGGIGLSLLSQVRCPGF